MKSGCREKRGLTAMRVIQNILSNTERRGDLDVDE